MSISERNKLVQFQKTHYKNKQKKTNARQFFPKKGF